MEFQVEAAKNVGAEANRTKPHKVKIVGVKQEEKDLEAKKTEFRMWV